MAKIFNPMRGGSPLGEALDSLGKQMFGNNTANALNSEKLYDAQRANTETDNLMRTVAAGGGAQSLASSPLAQAMLLGSGYDPGKFGDIALLGGATEFGARDPRTQNLQVGTGQSYDNTAGAFDLKLGETVRNNNLQHTDRRYGVDQGIAQQMYEFGNVSANDVVKNTEANRHNLSTEGETVRNNDLASADRHYGVDVGSRDTMAKFNLEPKPALDSSGRPTFVPQSDLAGGSYAPIISEADQKGTLLGQNFDDLPSLNPNQQEVLGARVDGTKTGTPRNYIVGDKSFITYDGVTDVQSGSPLPPGGYIGTVEGAAADVGLANSTKAGLQSGMLAYDKFKSTLDAARPLVSDPTLFGPQGFLRSKAQDLIQSLGGASALIGARREIGASLVSAETGALLGANAAAALIPELYDPRLGEVEALWGLLLYQGASALAGQDGRSVSDADIQMFRGILGDPHSFFASNLSMASKLDAVERRVAAGVEINKRYLEGGVPTDAPGASGGIDDLVNKYRTRN